MIDLDVEVVSFEDFLAEDAKSLSDASHEKKNGDQKPDAVDAAGIQSGTEKKDVVEQSDDKAPGDAQGEKLKEQC